MLKNKSFFLVVGPQRTGTTWLYDYLQRSKQCAVPLYVKETDFFGEKVDRNLEWYRDQFGVEVAYEKFADVSTKYISSTKAIEKVKSNFPDAIIVVIYRDPFERVVSLYHHLKSAENRRFSSLSEALQEEPWLLETSMYYQNTQRWVEAFGAGRVHVLDYRLLETDPVLYRAQINQLFGLQSFEGDSASQVVNGRTSGSSSMAARVVGLVVPTLRKLIGEKPVHGLKTSALGKFVVEVVLRRRSSEGTIEKINSREEAARLGFLKLIEKDNRKFCETFLKSSSSETV